MDAAQYKCPNCNAELVFDPNSQKLVCEFCRSEFMLDKIKAINAEASQVSPEETAQKDEFETHTNLYHCQNCGADIMAEDNTTATFCYYCHSPVILAGKLTGDFKPSKIIGFRIKREQALEAFNKWCNKKKFIPNSFKSQQQLEKMTGLYVPFWVTDCYVSAHYSAIGKKTRSWTSGNYHYTETKEFAVERDAEIVTRGVPADGASKIEDLLMESIEPFDYTAQKPFDMSYFSGFFADKYDVDRAAVFPRIRERVTQASRNVINSSVIGYSSTNVHSQDYNIDKTNWEYMMLPVWFMTYRYDNKIYEFAINGQTGKLAGTPPLDKGKLARSAALFGFIIALVLFIGGQFLI